MGLRLRLCLDDELIDLPWECLYRPDMLGAVQLNGFFLADGDMSLVREAASFPFAPAPTERTQRALFLGTLFNEQTDRWLVHDEFKSLQANTADIAERLAFDFLPTGDTAAVTRALSGRFDIFHYAGHVEAEEAPAFLIQTAHYDASQHPGFSEANATPATWTRADTLAPLLRAAGARLAVFNACNSGHWNFMRPLMAQGLPAAIGVQGAVRNDAALAFSSALYSALAVGLSRGSGAVPTSGDQGKCCCAATRATRTRGRDGRAVQAIGVDQRFAARGGDLAHRLQSGVCSWPLRRCTQTNAGCTA